MKNQTKNILCILLIRIILPTYTTFTRLCRDPMQIIYYMPLCIFFILITSFVKSNHNQKINTQNTK